MKKQAGRAPQHDLCPTSSLLWLVVVAAVTAVLVVGGGSGVVFIPLSSLLSYSIRCWWCCCYCRVRSGWGRPCVCFCLRFLVFLLLLDWLSPMGGILQWVWGVGAAAGHSGGGLLLIMRMMSRWLRGGI